MSGYTIVNGIAEISDPEIYSNWLDNEAFKAAVAADPSPELTATKRLLIEFEADLARIVRDNRVQGDTMDLVHQIHECLRVVDGLLLALGLPAVANSNPIQRAVRDIHVLATHGAFRVDPMAEINGRELFGLEPFPMMWAISSPPPGGQPLAGSSPPGGLPKH